MIPGVNPRQLKQMMKQMGMSQVDLDASEIIIKTRDGKNLIFENPQVQKVTMQGQETYQITGSPRIEEIKLKISISSEDISMVAEQSGKSKEEAEIALNKVNGDIAEAIINLSN